MIKKIDIGDILVSKKVVDLQQASYKIEEEITNINNLPPLKDTVHDLMNCRETFYGYLYKDELVGIVSFKVENRVLDIHRVAVDPSCFRKGYATSLLNYIQENIKGVKKYVVSTSVRNKPAIDLYLKNGFEKVREKEVERNIRIVVFEKLR